VIAGAEMVPCVKATVALHEGETEHWAVNEDGDLQVTVKSHTFGSPITAVLGALVGGNGKGVWTIPPIGTEVLVAFPDGDFEGDAVLCAVLSTGSVPDGLTDGNVIVVGDEVIVHDGNGGAGVEVRPTEIKIGGGAAPHEPTLKATTYRAAEDALIAAIGTLVTALGTAHVVVPSPGPYPDAGITAAVIALTAQIAAFTASSPTYLTTIAKVR
jgi:type VI secretion system (T6SS) baseplate-like injector VgrG